MTTQQEQAAVPPLIREFHMEDGDVQISDAWMVAESFATSPEDPAGMCIIDTACGRTMHGPGWKRRYLDAQGVPPIVEAPSEGIFRGIGGS